MSDNVNSYFSNKYRAHINDAYRTFWSKNGGASMARRFINAEIYTVSNAMSLLSKLEIIEYDEHRAYIDALHAKGIAGINELSSYSPFK